MRLTMGLFGAGRMGSTLAHQLAFAIDSANLVAIGNPYEDNACKIAAKFNVPYLHRDRCGPFFG